MLVLKFLQNNGIIFGMFKCETTSFNNALKITIPLHSGRPVLTNRNCLSNYSLTRVTYSLFEREWDVGLQNRLAITFAHNGFEKKNKNTATDCCIITLKKI